LTASGAIEAYQHLCREEGVMMRTLVLSTVVLALLGAASVVVAQSGDEAAVAQALEAFRNAMLKADRSQF
jgi:hypothetical protein